MSRENAEAKATRYLAEGRLIVRELDEHGGTCSADCRGDGAIYALGRDEGGRWYCACPARGRCAHLVALQLVVAVGPRGGRA